MPLPLIRPPRPRLPIRAVTTAKQNPLAVLDPGFTEVPPSVRSYKADMAAVNEYLAQLAVRELFPPTSRFKWGRQGRRQAISCHPGFDPTARLRSTVRKSLPRLPPSSTPSAALAAEVSMTMNAEGTSE